MNREVSSNRFPYIPIVVTINDVSTATEALIDTGFDGFVLLPEANFPEGISGPLTFQEWVLADGSHSTAVYCDGEVSIGGVMSGVAAQITFLGEEALVGRGLLDLYRVTLDHGARVIVEA